MDPEDPDNPEKDTWTEEGKRSLGVLQTYSGTLRQRALEGKWVSPEGIVFPALDVNVHILSRFQIPPTWAKFRSIDFGLSHPFVCQWWAVDDEHRMYLYREIYMSNVHIEEHAHKIKELSEGEEILYTVVDYEAKSDIETLHRHGIWTDPADKEKAFGIQLMYERFKVDPVTKRTQIYFLENALVEEDEKLSQRFHPKCTFESLINLTYRENKTGSKLDEEPLKRHDDGFDATRLCDCVAGHEQISGQACACVQCEHSDGFGPRKTQRFTA